MRNHRGLLSWAPRGRGVYVLALVLVVSTALAVGLAFSLGWFSGSSVSKSASRSTIPTGHGNTSSGTASAPSNGTSAASGGTAVRGRGTTGPSAGVALHTHIGDYLIEAPNVTVTGMHITGNLRINGPARNVAVSDVRVDGEIDVNSDTPSQGGVGIVPKDVVIRHTSAHGLYTSGFDGLTLDGVEIATVKGGGTLAQIARYQNDEYEWPASHLTILNSWFHGLTTPGPDAHLEAIHLMGISTFTLRNTVFDATAPDQATFLDTTQCLTMETAFGGVVSSNGTVDGNSFYGGGYYQVGFYMSGASSVTNNRFHSYVSPDGSIKGKVQYPPPDGAPTPRYSGNTLDGRPFTLD